MLAVLLRIRAELALFWMTPKTDVPITALMVVLEFVVLVVVPLLVMLPLKFNGLAPLKVILELFVPFAALLWMVRFPVPVTPPPKVKSLPPALLVMTLRLLLSVTAPFRTWLQPVTLMEEPPLPTTEMGLVEVKLLPLKFKLAARPVLALSPMVTVPLPRKFPPPPPLSLDTVPALMIRPLDELVPLRTRVPVPALVRLYAPLIAPLTVRLLAELLVQVWLAPRATGAAMVLAGTLAFMVMPAALAMVRV